MSEETVLKYLRDINAKVTILVDRVDVVEKRIGELGVGCRESFERVRKVIKSLHDVTEALAVQQKGTREDLAEYGGTIEADSWWS